jgi:hypothetical protein
MVAGAIAIGSVAVWSTTCGGESVASVEERLGDHEHITTLLPDDATALSELYCRSATALTSNTCTVIYATSLNLRETQEHYRAIYNGRGWERLVDNA